MDRIDKVLNENPVAFETGSPRIARPTGNAVDFLQSDLQRFLTEHSRLPARMGAWPARVRRWA